MWIGQRTLYASGVQTSAGQDLGIGLAQAWHCLSMALARPCLGTTFGWSWHTHSMRLGLRVAHGSIFGRAVFVADSWQALGRPLAGSWRCRRIRNDPSLGLFWPYSGGVGRRPFRGVNSIKLLNVLVLTLEAFDDIHRRSANKKGQSHVDISRGDLRHFRVSQGAGGCRTVRADLCVW